ncbi:MAG: hypothetical protein KAX99_00905 [Azonexus sp.]|nr:hypothetical protein [Azonexus sp.]MBP8168196.1 hypothetical protein [Azonexus sp.]
MKLTFTTDGREALPVRSIPWVAAHERSTCKVTLPPSLLILAAHTACRAEDAVPGIPPLRLYRIGENGAQPVSIEYLNAIAPESNFQPETDEPLRESTSRLPAGVFVFLDELRSFVDWIFPPGSHDGECRDAIKLNTSPDLPGEMIEELHEGFVAPKPNAQIERCNELATLPELRVHHWEELTGVGICEGGSYAVNQDGVFPEKYSNRDLHGLTQEERHILLEHSYRPPLKFPCTPSQLLKFVDGDVSRDFDVPDNFRAVVEARARLVQKDSEQNAISGTPEIAEQTDGEQNTSSEAPECVEIPQPKRRDTRNIALLRDLETKVPSMTIECIWLYIRQNAGMDSSLFKTAGNESATTKDEEKILKKSLGRSLLRYLKINTTTNKVQARHR